MPSIAANALLACAVCMAPGHRTSEAIGYAIIMLLAFLLPVLGGLIALIVTLARRSKAAHANDRAHALTLDPSSPC